MVNRSEWMHSFISSQSCLLLTKCHALWLSQLQDGSNIQMHPNLFRDEILSFEMMVMLNIVGLNFWTSAVFLWHVFVFLLAKLETLFGFVLRQFIDGVDHLRITEMKTMVIDSRDSRDEWCHESCWWMTEAWQQAAAVTLLAPTAWRRKVKI